MNKIINIEIMQSPYLKGSWCIRIGDIAGSSEHSNCPMDEVLDDIANEMLRLNQNIGKPSKEEQ